MHPTLARRRPLTPAGLILLLLSTLTPVARAETGGETTTIRTSTATPTPPASPRSGELDPRAACACSGYVIDPVADAALLGASFGFGGLLELILSTGELRPQEPIDPDRLLSIDRKVALSDHPEHSAPRLSDVVVGVVATYAVTDVLRAGLSGDRPKHEWLRSSVLYLESGSVTWAINNLVKVAVRRPRPFAYEEKRKMESTNMSTNAALSFYSLHTALVASVSSTAAYLAFERAPRSIEPWVVAGIGVVATTFVGIQRVRAHAHFPTDVLAGAMAGAGVGLLVPHLHRAKQGVAVAVGPIYTPEGGAGLSIAGRY